MVVIRRAGGGRWGSEGRGGRRGERLAAGGERAWGNVEMKNVTFAPRIYTLAAGVS